MVEIEMPQRPDVLGFVAANLARLSPSFGAGFAGALVQRNPRLSHQAVSLHVALDRGIRAEAARARDCPSPGRRGCRSAIGSSSAGDLSTGDGSRSAMAAPERSCRGLCGSRGARRRPDRRRCPARRVVPSLDGDGCETDIASGHRMRPGLLGKRIDRCLERSAQGESSRVSPRRRIEIAPKGRRSNWGVLGSSRLLADGVKEL